MADEIKVTPVNPSQTPIATINVTTSAPNETKEAPVPSLADPRAYEHNAPWGRGKLRSWLKTVMNCDDHQAGTTRHTRSCKNTFKLVKRLIEKHGEEKILDYFSRPEIQREIRSKIPEMNSHIVIQGWLDGNGGMPLCFAKFFLDFASEHGTNVDSVFPRLRVS